MNVLTRATAAAVILAAAPLHAERVLPPPPPLDKSLVVVDWQVESKDDRVRDLAVRTLQGLVNRKKAGVWVGTEMREGSPGWWFAKYREMKLVSSGSGTLSREQFLMRYRSYAKGVVVPPANIGPGGYRVAVMKAAADGLIVGSREMARELGLPVSADYSTRFKSYADSWQYALDTLWPRLAKDILFVDRDDLDAATSPVDYVVQNRIPMCAPHKDRPEELGLFRKTLGRLAANSPVLGSAGGGEMLSEGDIVREVSKAGCVFMGCSNVANISVHAAIRAPRLSAKPPRKRPALDPSKVYVAVEISDGDNANAYFTHFPRRGLLENCGRAPLGWTMGQAITELAPGVTYYYRSTMTPLDELITGVSGYAYMFPGDFGNALAPAQKEAAWRGFLKRTDEFLSLGRMSVVTTLQYQEKPGVIGPDVFARYAKGLKRASAIINGYNAVYQEYGGKAVEIVDGLPVFHTVTDRTWSEPGQRTLADDLMERTPRERPAFVALFMIPFALRPDHFDQVVASLKTLEQKGYVLVLPSELAALLRESRGLPAVP